MGALCVQTNQFQANRKAATDRKALEAENSPMAQIIKTYTRFYGEPVTKQTEDFIQNNYEWSYYSTTKSDGVNQTGVTTYRSEIVNRLSEAHKSGSKTYRISMEEVQQQSGRLWQNWSISTKNGIVNYRCFAEFNQNKKLFRQTFTRLLNTQISKYVFEKPKVTTDFSSSYNLSYQRSPQRFDGDAYVRQQNADFRDRMNKQAQEWNNYVTQKNNRGW